MSHATSRIVRALVEISGLPMTEDEISTLEASYEAHREALGHLRSIEDQEYPVSMAPSATVILADRERTQRASKHGAGTAGC